MPFPRTWSEELIAEWLQLKGYFVEVGVPTRSGTKGGRGEADVVGVRSRNGDLEILHVEVGGLPGNPKQNAEMIRRKFSQRNVNAIKEYCSSKLASFPDQRISYERLYVAVWGSGRTMSYLREQQLPVRSLMEFVRNEIKPTIREWKKEPPHKPQTRGKGITLPEGMWLLDLVDYLLE